MNKEEVKVEEEVKKVISVTPGAVKNGGATRRNSTGQANTKTSASLINGDEEVLPHYLRASTNSCHEFCKYGRKHLFEVKKRRSNFRKIAGSTVIPDEATKTEASNFEGNGKRSQLKVKTTSQKCGVLCKPAENEQNGPKEVQNLSGNATLEKESFEASERMKLHILFPNIASPDHFPDTEVEKQCKGPVSIMEVTLAAHQTAELSNTSETTNLEGSSPTEKRVISQDPTTPLSLSERSLDVSERMDMETSSPIHKLTNHEEGLSEEFLWVEIMNPSAGVESMGLADESSGLNPSPISATMSLKAKVVPPGRRTTSVKARTSGEKLSGKASSIKLKNLSSNFNSLPATGKGNVINNLKAVEGKNRDVTKVKENPQMKTEGSVRAKSIKENRIGLTSQPTGSEKKIVSPVEKIIAASVKPKIAEGKIPSSLKNANVSLSPRHRQNASSTIKRTESPSSISSKLKSSVVKSALTLVSSRKLSAQRNMEDKVARSTDLSKLREEPALKSSSTSGVTKPPSPGKIEVEVGKLEDTNNKLKLKTLYVIEPKPVKTALKPLKKVLKKSRPYLSSVSSMSEQEKEANEDCKLASKAKNLVLNKEKTKSIKPVHSLKPEEKKRLIKPGIVSVPSEVKLPSPQKLNFRRGRVVNPMPEDNAPRKLEFRPSKCASNNQNSKESGRRILRRRRVSCGSASELITPSLKSHAVVLKHQDVQEKKETQGLFNHVIEETASKLVETRKSKVKALVGAFETVISLQVAPTI